MNIDFERLANTKQGKNIMETRAGFSAERKGREAAFADIDSRGFAYAYNQADMLINLDTPHEAARFMCGYRQAVLGYFMAL